jgi:hypothetical protein
MMLPVLATELTSSEPPQVIPHTSSIALAHSAGRSLLSRTCLIFTALSTTIPRSCSLPSKVCSRSLLCSHVAHMGSVLGDPTAAPLQVAAFCFLFFFLLIGLSLGAARQPWPAALSEETAAVGRPGSGTRRGCSGGRNLRSYVSMFCFSAGGFRSLITLYWYRRRRD